MAEPSPLPSPRLGASPPRTWVTALTVENTPLKHEPRGTARAGRTEGRLLSSSSYGGRAGAGRTDRRVLSSQPLYGVPDPRPVPFILCPETEGLLSISKTFSYYKHNWANGKPTPQEPAWMDLDYVPARRRKHLRLDRADLRHLGQDLCARKLADEDMREARRKELTMALRNERLQKLKTKNLQTRDMMARIGVHRPPTATGTAARLRPMVTCLEVRPRTAAFCVRPQPVAFGATVGAALA